jgi:hypothetical protein
MSDADFCAAFRLLERTITLLDTAAGGDPGEHRRAIGRLLLEIDLLRARLGQPAAESRRN